MFIKTIEYYFPQKKLTNIDLKREFPEWDSQKVDEKIGIKSRYVVADNETSLDLAYNVCEKIFKNIDREEIDCLILCTQSPDYFLPSSACVLQDRLGLKTSVGAFDFNLGCSGYVYGLSIAKGLLASNVANKILFITAETYTKMIYKKDISNRAIFGDGATATILSAKAPGFNIGDFILGTDGSGFSNLIVKNGGFRSPLNDNPKEIIYGNGNLYTDNHLYMNGPEIFSFTISRIPKLVSDVLLKNDLTIGDIDYFIFHQANKFMLEYLCRKMKISESKFYINMKETGNTVSNTIPIAIKDCIDRDVFSNGSNIMIVGFGVGYSWGATILKKRGLNEKG